MKICVVFVVVLCAGVRFSASQPEPKRCCISKQFEASLTDLSTIKSLNMTIMSLALDFEKQLQATESAVYDTLNRRSTALFKTIFDFRKGMQYDIPADDPSKCFTRQISRPVPPRCVPADAQYLGSTYLGPVNALPYDGWRFPYTSTEAQLTMAFTTDGCVPVIESVFGEFDNEPVDMMFLFTTFSPNISNPNVFDLPPSCNKA